MSILTNKLINTERSFCMESRTPFRLTKSELEIMEVLWQEGRPLSRSFIISHAPHRSWKDSSIHILLNSMLDKGAIKIVGFEQTGRRIARTFLPTLTPDEYYVMQIKSRSIYTRESLPNLVSALIADDVDDELLDKLIAVIQQRKEQLHSQQQG